MTASRDPDRLIRAFLDEGEVQLHDQVYDAVRAEIETKRQRAFIGPWSTYTMNKIVTVGLGAAAVVVIGLLLGAQLLGDPSNVGGPGNPTPTPQASATSESTPVASAPPGGSVQYQSDGRLTTTQVDLDADGAGLSGTAVTTSSRGTHTVRLECFARDVDTWALGGTSEETTIPGERAGDWSAVIVREGVPQRIAIWLSEEKVDGSDCDGFLALMDLADIDPDDQEIFLPVESGTLVPPPDPAS